MKKAVVCSFRDKSDEILGFTAPAKYEVFEKETPRLPIKAAINQPECGFDNSGMALIAIQYSLYLFDIIQVLSILTIDIK